MAKKKEQAEKIEPSQVEYKKPAQEPVSTTPKLPPELEEKLKSIKEKIDKFQKIILEKFDKYICGIALLPPPRAPVGTSGTPGMGMPGSPGQYPGPALPQMPQQGQDGLSSAVDGQAPQLPDPNKINLLILIDDTEPSRMPKQELRDKLVTILENTAKEVDTNIAPQTVLLSELWQNCYDGKTDALAMIAMSAPLYDTGMLSALRVSEIHKQMVLGKFDKYIVCYILAGSLVQGKATPQSDIDVFVVIDDTDVKKMTRGELKDKLRSIILGMAIQVGEETGVRNKLNIQVYILTDFWESVREANPVIFTFLRDGIPLFDRGIFMPWKQLLKLGKIRPSAEAIDMYMSSGDQMLERVKFKIKDIGMEDIFYALLTPSQAAIMMYGTAPPTPKETPDVMREIFVKKEKLMTDEEVDILAKTIQVRKELEHGTKKEVTGKEVDDLLENAEKYLKRLKKLFTQIEKIREKEAVLHAHDSVMSAAREILKLEGKEKVKDADMVKELEDSLISTGKIPAKYLRTLNSMMQAKKDFDAGKLSTTETDVIRKDANELVRTLVEYVQRSRGKELERAKLRVKYGDKFAELIMLSNVAYVIRDLDAPTKQVEKVLLNPDGSLNLSTKVVTSLEEFENAIATAQLPQRVFIKQPVFDDLKKLFGNHVEVLVTN